MSTVLLIALLFITAYRFYKHRDQFKQLTNQEWKKYIIGFVAAWGSAVVIIFSSAWLLDALHVQSYRFIFGVFFIVVALFVASAIFERFVPNRLRTMYK